MDNRSPEEPYGAQVAVAVAIGIFGILGIFVAIKAIGGHIIEDPYWWTTDIWKLGTVITLAYLGLVTLGLVCYVFRRMYEATMDEYMDARYTKYQMDILGIGKTNRLNHIIMKLGGWGVKKSNYKGVWIISIAYLLITLSLLVFIGIY